MEQKACIIQRPYHCVRGCLVVVDGVVHENEPTLSPIFRRQARAPKLDKPALNVGTVKGASRQERRRTYLLHAIYPSLLPTVNSPSLSGFLMVGHATRKSIVRPSPLSASESAPVKHGWVGTRGLMDEQALQDRWACVMKERRDTLRAPMLPPLKDSVRTSTPRWGPNEPGLSRPLSPCETPLERELTGGTSPSGRVSRLSA